MVKQVCVCLFISRRGAVVGNGSLVEGDPGFANAFFAHDNRTSFYINTATILKWFSSPYRVSADRF